MKKSKQDDLSAGIEPEKLPPAPGKLASGTEVKEAIRAAKAKYEARMADREAEFDRALGDLAPAGPGLVVPLEGDTSVAVLEALSDGNSELAKALVRIAALQAILMKLEDRARAGGDIGLADIREAIRVLAGS